MAKDRPVILNTPGAPRTTRTVVKFLVEYKSRKWLPLPYDSLPDDEPGARAAYRALKGEPHLYQGKRLRLLRRVSVVTDEILEEDEP